MQQRHEISVDDERIIAVHHDAPTDDWIIFCHGFQSDKSGSYESRCERTVAQGYNAVRFDFRGCGESDREFAEQTLSTRLADLQAVLDHFEVSNCVLFGSSFGGKVAFHAAADDDRIDAVATRAPVTDNRAFEKYRPPADSVKEADTARDSDSTQGPGDSDAEIPGGDWSGFFADLDRYPFEPVARSLSVPVAIFHGREDDSVAVGDSIEATEALEVDVLLQVYAGEGHRFSREAEARMREQLFRWLE